MPIFRTAISAMRVRLSDAEFLRDLKNFLEAAECQVRQVGLATLDVAMPRAPSEAQARREIEIYLKTRRAMNPQVTARIVGKGEAERPD
jgi:hypothetical protein